MTGHKVRVRRWRGLKEMCSLRAHNYPQEGAPAWWLTCSGPSCSINKGTWTYSWSLAIKWALHHRAHPDDEHPPVPEGWTWA